VEHLETSLQQLRIVDLATGYHSSLISDSAASTPSTRMPRCVRLGLRMRVAVHGGYRSKHIKPLLDLFPIFHGPHNEVCIQGYEDIQYTLSIEESIIDAGSARDDL
jgi:hypothetical protein